MATPSMGAAAPARDGEMLRITKAQDQAMRLAMGLAQAGGQRTLAELAAAEGLPEPTVAKLLARLRRGGVVSAVRGRNGGYELARAPERISAAEVLRCVGAEPMRLGCSPAGRTAAGDCPRHRDCGLRPVWRHLQRRITHVMESTTLSDLLAAEAVSRRRLEELWPAATPAPAAGRGPAVPGAAPPAGRHGGLGREGVDWR